MIHNNAEYYNISKLSMTFRTEFLNAAKLFLLLAVLIWSFTWNSFNYFDLDFRSIGVTKEHISSAESDQRTMSVNSQRPNFVESFSTIRYKSEEAVESSSTAVDFMPSFYEWKKSEITKYEKDSSRKDPDLHPSKKPVRRKLNYASSKCGAKVLASNREARHRAAVLSEKPDEYMLNPCRAKTWFVVELCDTVEASQFELANHELYSSSPREFSVFWSDVYPALEWQLLGSFEARDQRTMQTFDLKTQKLMKFIKVVIYNHHGKEHYCPLSVIRVLGYSMVQKFEDIEISESNPNGNDLFSKKIAMFQKERPSSKNNNELRRIYGEDSHMLSTKTCSLFFTHCSEVSRMNTHLNLCFRSSMTCAFFLKVMPKSIEKCHQIYCPTESSEFHRLLGVLHEAESDGMTQPNVRDGKNKFPSIPETKNAYHKKTIQKSESCGRRIFGIYKHEMRSKAAGDNQCSAAVDNNHCSAAVDNNHCSAAGRITRINDKRLTSEAEESNFSKGYMNENSTSNESASSIDMTRHPLIEESQVKCVCTEQEKALQSAKHLDGMITDASQATFPGEISIESAGLIHTESVLFKLTARIKSLEVDLNLINTYLQQLSESYRQQMVSMKAMFDHTLKVIHIQSENDKMVDKAQGESLTTLERKSKALSQKIDFLMSGQKHMLKKVIELHGFFLLLELIILSTIFTLSLNILNRKYVSGVKSE